MNEKGQAPDIQHCRYNDAHRYPKVEMEFHQAHCKDQHSVVKHIQFHTSRKLVNFAISVSLVAVKKKIRMKKMKLKNSMLDTFQRNLRNKWKRNNAKD